MRYIATQQRCSPFYNAKYYYLDNHHHARTHPHNPSLWSSRSKYLCYYEIKTKVLSQQLISPTCSKSNATSSPAAPMCTLPAAATGSFT